MPHPDQTRSPEQPAPPQSPRGLRRWVAGLAIAWCLLYGGFLALRTAPIREANSDDVTFERLARSPTPWEDSVRYGRYEGRFYMPVANSAPETLYALDNPVLFSAGRALLVLADASVVGLLFARLLRSRRFGLLVTITSLIFLQIPLGFTGILSSPQVSVGFILCCLVLLQLAGGPGQAGRPPSALLTGMAVFAAGCMNECFMAPLLVAAAAAYAGLWNPGRPRPAFAALLRLSGPAPGALGGLVAYVAVYAAFRRIHPPAYTGVSLTLHPGAVASCFARFTGASLPGVELLLARHGFQGGALLKTGAQIRALFGAVAAGEWAFLAAGLGTAAALVPLCAAEVRARCASAKPLRALAAAGLCGLFFNVPISLTGKYQEWSHQRQYPYFYSLCTWFIFCGIAAAAVVLAVRADRPGAGLRRGARRIGGIAALGLAAILASAVWASNRHVIRVLSASMYPVPDSVYRDSFSACGRGPGTGPGR